MAEEHCILGCFHGDINITVAFRDFLSFSSSSTRRFRERIASIFRVLQGDKTSQLCYSGITIDYPLYRGILCRAAEDCVFQPKKVYPRSVSVFKSV
jgi:hypothetical protein